MNNYFYSILLILTNVLCFGQKQNIISPRWLGNYSLNFSQNRNYSTEMYWEHHFKISKNSCIYEGTGFQFYIKYECATKENKDTLLIYAKKYQDGYQTYDKNELISKIYKFKNMYFTKTLNLKPEEAKEKPTKLGFRMYKKL